MYEGENAGSQRFPRVHDLLQLTHVSGDTGDALPAWVGSPLAIPTWVVVRRTRAPIGKISIGLRGSERHQRWGTVTDAQTVAAALSPEHLHSTRAHGSRYSLPAMVALRAVENAWSNCSVCWGPGGSVGYELASGRTTVTPQSDLDLVVYAPQLLRLVQIDDLWQRLRGLACKVDVRVETSVGGFSMEEYIRNRGRAILLRTADGPRICDDPWAPGEAAAER